MDNKIRITDLANPEYSEKAKELLAMVASLEPEISVDAVYREADKQLEGVEAYRDDGMLERLSVLCRAFDEDVELSAMGRVTILQMLAGYLVQRSRLEDLYRRHPEIDDQVVEKPLIIAGFPRSGTTHLLNLLSADDRFRSLRYWESLEPIPRRQEQGEPSVGEDPRLQRCREQLAMRDEIMPLFNAMHDMHPEHIHEEIELMAMDFSTTLFDTIGYVPRWVHYYTGHDQTPHYHFLKRALKALQWLKGPKRWLLKSPQHMEQLIPLKTAFPDATFVLTHRDPVSVMASFLTMLTYSARMSRTVVRPEKLGRYYSDRMLQRLRRFVADRDQLPPEQTIDVLFHEFMADDMGTIEKIYNMAGLPLTDPIRARMRQYIDANPRGKHGQVIYDLAGDFHLDPARLRESVADYYEKFPVRIES